MGTVICKHGKLEGDIRESAVKGRCHRITCKGYVEQYSFTNNDIWIRLGHRIQECAVKMCYIRVYGVTKWEGESNKSVYERCDIQTCANGVLWCN